MKKPGWKHIEDAITTDQKNLTDDKHIHEQEKHKLKSNEKNKGFIPEQDEKATPGKKL